MNKKYFSILAFAILIESLITYSNNFFVTGAFSWEMVTSLIIGVIIAVAYKIDLLKMLDFESKFPYVGSIVTGILLSRGSNYIFDLINKLFSYTA